MKHFLVTTMFMAGAAVLATAQSFCWNESFSCRVNALAKGAGDRWHVGGESGDPTLSFGRGFLATSSNGAFLNAQTFNLVENTSVRSIIPFANATVLVGGQADGCDFGYSGFLRLYNEQGGVIWTTVREDNGSNQVIYFKDMEILADSSILVCGNGLQRFELSTGAPVETLDVGSLNDMVKLSDQSILLAGPGGLYQLNQNLSPTLLLPESDYFKAHEKVVQMLNSATVAVMRADGTILKCIVGNNNAVITAQLTLDFLPLDIIYFNNQLIVCGIAGNKGKILILDNDLQPVGGFVLPDHEKIPMRMAQHGDQIMLAGIEYHGPTPIDLSSPAYWISPTSSNVWMESYTLDGLGQTPTQDAGITNVTAASLPIADCPVDPGPPVCGITLPKYTVKVKNFGTEPLTDVRIMASGFAYDLPYICPTLTGIVQELNNLNVPPGEEVTVQVSPTNPVYQYSYNLSDWQICFWTELPNNSIDRDHTNDAFCLPQTFTVAVNDPSPRNTLLVYPNPAGDVVFLDYPEPVNLHYQIIDLQGKILLEGISDPAAKNRIDLSALPSGCFFLNVEGRVEKLVVVK